MVIVLARISVYVQHQGFMERLVKITHAMGTITNTLRHVPHMVPVLLLKYAIVHEDTMELIVNFQYVLERVLTILQYVHQEEHVYHQILAHVEEVTMLQIAR